jgi:hypothetical protein
MRNFLQKATEGNKGKDVYRETAVAKNNCGKLSWDYMISMTRAVVLSRPLFSTASFTRR